MTNNRVFRRNRETARRILTGTAVRMITGRKLSDGSTSVAGADVNKAWVRETEESRGEVQVWGTALKPDVPVWVDDGPDGRYIVGVVWNEGTAKFGAALPALVLPPPMGDVTGMTVDGLNFKPGRFRQSSLGFPYVHVDPLHYDNGFWRGGDLDSSLPGGLDQTADDLDLTAYLPATAGEVGWLVSYLDPDDGLVHLQAGATVAGSISDLDEADIHSISLPDGVIPLGALGVENGMTDFGSNPRWVDIRNHIGGYDRAGYVVLAPDSLLRNTITPTGDFHALVLQSSPTQSVPVLLVDSDVLDPPADYIAGNIDLTQALTANNASGTTALQLQVNLNNATFNNSSAGNRCLQLRMVATGTAGTISNLLVTQQSITVTGGVAVTTIRNHRINDTTVSGGSTVTNNTGLVLVERTSGTNNVHILIGPLSNPTGNFAIYSSTSYPSSHLGNFGLGLAASVTPTEMLSLSGQAARKIWMERRTTSNAVGFGLTLQSGGASSGGTNRAAGALVLATGVNTGNSVPAIIQLQTGVMNPTSGTGDNALVDRLLIGPTKVLTNNTATTIVNATAAAGLGIGGIIRYSIMVSDGTDLQTETGFAVFSGVNKGGTFTVLITEVNSQQSLSAGTLATTWAITGANPAAISVNANSSLTPSSGFPRITYSIENFSQQAIAAA